MSKINALAGLIGNYGDSDEESDDGGSKTVTGSIRNGFSSDVSTNVHSASDVSAAIHPAPIPHCPWSACYDENSGFTYYWNQQTNAVTWEAPPEYLLALKLAQQQLNSAGSTEVSAEEWQLYQQALAEKQNTTAPVIPKPTAPEIRHPRVPEKNSKAGVKRRNSDVDEKIELITSYHNSDSDSNDESESPVKVQGQVPVAPKTPKLPKPQTKKQKTHKVKEYGPALPPNQNYTVPIGPEMPPELMETLKDTTTPTEQVKKSKTPDNEDSQDESLLLNKLKDKAKLLEKLGGEIPVELQKIIQDETNSKPNSPKVVESTKETKSLIDTNIDDLLQEIEKKELPKVVKKRIDMFSEEAKSNDGSVHNSPRSNGVVTPPLEEIKALFPSSKNIVDIPTTSLFPSAANIQESDSEKDVKENANTNVADKKGANLYLADVSEVTDKPSRKKLRISNSVLPAKKPELPSYTTKYAQSIDGTNSERTGLGFSKDDEDESSTPKNTISYGNGLMFTKGETLNEDKKDEDLDDLTDLLEAKLKYLNQLQPGVISPVQEMMIQMQTLVAAFRVGALSRAYWRRWALGAGAALRRHEAGAAPPGWTCVFQRSEGRYRYEREADGLVQWEYPAAANMDMDISTTPPHPGIEAKEEVLPPLPPAPPAQPPPPPARPVTPPPPAWVDPPPPGTDDLATVAPPLPPEPKQEIGDELTSFYNDIAELEKTVPISAPISAPASHGSSPEPKMPDPPLPRSERERSKEKEREKPKKKSKVKISSSIGMKHKSVSSLVAKWQQVAEEINSD